MERGVAVFDLQTEAKEVREIGSRIDYLQKSILSEEQSLESAKTKLDRTKDAQEILQELAQAVQQKVHERIASVVTTCLETVFDDPYSFKIVFEQKRGRTEASLRFVRGGLDLDPMTASGGGVLDVAAFALRISCLMLHRPRLSRILIADEPFRFVSAQYQDNIRVMLERLSKEMGMQIVMVTHQPAYETGKVIEL